MGQTLVTISSSAGAAAVAKRLLDRGGSAADAVAAASMIQIVEAAGTYVSFAGMLVGLHYDAATGRVDCIDGDYAIPAAGRGDTLPRLYQEGKTGAGPLVPGYWGGIRELLAHFGTLPFGEIIAPAIERCAAGFAPSERLVRRLRHRQRTAPGCVETFAMRDGNVMQPELVATLREIAARGPDTMYTGAWGAKFVETVRGAGGVIDEADMAAYRGEITEPITARYRDSTLFAPPPPNAGGLITLLILRMIERLDLRERGHFTENPDTYLALISGLRAYMPFLNRLLGNIDEQGLMSALGGRSIRLEDALRDETIDALWDAIRAGALETVPMAKPDNTDAVAAIDGAGNIVILIHSACATTGRDGLVVDGISLPRMAAEAPGAVAYAKKRVAGIFSPIMALNAKKVVAAGAIHASLFEKQSATLLNVMEYGLPLAEANARPTPLFPDYDQTGAFTEVMFLEQFTPEFLAGLRARGLRVKDARAGGLGRFITEENLDLLESPLVGVEAERATGAALGVTSGRYDGAALGG